MGPVTALTDRFPDALAYATRVHAGQTRKGGDVPYVSHLLAVSALVLEHDGDEDQAIAALLHDALEDQGDRTSSEEIARRYGARVARIVRSCSDAEAGSPEARKPPWRPRKERYLAHLEECASDVLLVAAADKLHNARTVLADYRLHGEALWSRFTAGRDGQLWYYGRVADVVRRRLGGPLADELDRVVAELTRLASAS